MHHERLRELRGAILKQTPRKRRSAVTEDLRNNPERFIDEVRAAGRTAPELFNMSSYADLVYEAGDCQTCGCIAGTAITLFGLDDSAATLDASMFDHARERLEIDEATARHLFMPEVDRRLWQELTPDDAARAIDHVMNGQDPTPAWKQAADRILGAFASKRNETGNKQQPPHTESGPDEAATDATG